MCGGRHFISPAGLLIGGLAALQLVDDRPAPIQTRAAAPLVTEKNTNCSECGEVIHKVFNWCPACGSQLPKSHAAMCFSSHAPIVGSCCHLVWRRVLIAARRVNNPSQFREKLEWGAV